MVTVQFEIALGHGPQDVPGAGDWTDLSERLIQPIVTDLGSDRAQAQFALDDADGQLHPDILGRVLMRHARLAVHDGTGWQPVWRGLVQQWSPAWRYGESRRTVILRDMRSWLSLVDGVDVDLPRQRSGVRVTALLDLADWPADLRDVDAGDRGGIRLTALNQDGANIRRLLDDTADAEDGLLWCDPQGRLAFRSRIAGLDLTPTLTVVGDTSTAGDVVAEDGVEPDYDTDQLVTVAQVQLANREVIERTADTATVEDLGRRVHAVRDLSLPRSEAGVLAEWVVYGFAEERLSVPRLGVDATQDLPLVLGVEVGDLVRFVHDPGGASQQVDGRVERVRHRMVHGGMSTSFDLSPYFGDGPWFAWDDAARGWDSGAVWGP